MNHFQNLGAFILRLVAVLSVGLGLLGLAYRGLASVMGSAPPADADERLAGAVWYLIGGLLLFVLSRPLGRLLGKGLE